MLAMSTVNSFENFKKISVCCTPVQGYFRYEEETFTFTVIFKEIFHLKSIALKLFA